MSLQAGHQLAHYEILELIGRDGMGEVYRATDSKLGRDVAIKVLPDEFAQDEERLRRFQREAKVLASLNHPNIAAIYGLEQSGDTHYLVLELVPGETLADRIARGPVPVEEALGIATKIADALEEAHEQGIVHRDLKPANVKLTEDGKVKVLDFGLAKALVAEGPEGDVAASTSPTITREATRIGVILGTAAYMSPEQARGKIVDKRTDIFAFGSVLFEMLSGKKAFDGEMVSDILAAVINLDPDWSQLPGARLDKLVRRCLEKDPRRRLRDIGDARPELEEVSTPEPTRRIFSRRTFGLVVALGLAAGIGIVFGLAGFVSSPLPKEVTRFSIALPPTTRYVNSATPDFAVSPDGSALVFARDQGFFLRHLDREEIERIPGVGSSSSSPLNPFFSPNGDWVGFVAKGQLQKASLGGGPLVAICAAQELDVFGADWGEDGTIVFVQGDTGVWRVSADGGEPELVVKNDEMVIRYPQLIGDRHIIFVDIGANRSPAEFEIVAASLETGERRRLGLRGTQPKYLPSGHLVFADQNQLMAVPFDRYTMTVVGAPVALVDGVPVSGGRQAALFDVSSSGTLAYLDLSATRELTWVDRDGNTLSTVFEQRQPNDVRFSPDGKSAVIRDNSAGVDIWVYDIERETFSRLTSSPFFDEVPIWSPEGRFIAYTTSTNKPGRVLNRRAADGSGSEEALWQTPHHAHLGGWIDEGKTFVAAENRPDTGWDVFVLNAEGEPSPTYILDSSFDERNPRLDPTGKWLAYESNQSGTYEVYVTSFPELGPRRLVSSGGGDEPVWSPDGTELYYRDPTHVWAVAVGDGPELSVERPVALFPNRFYDGDNHTTYDAHPDGRFLFVATTTAEDDPYRSRYRFKIVRNWMVEVEERVPAP